MLTIFYEQTNGRMWSKRDWYWATDQRLDRWKGVTLNDSGRVTGLKVSAPALLGTLPWQLANLTELETLSITGGDDFTDLTGPIPPEWTALRNLRELNIQGVRMDGPIPPELANLEKLDTLILNSNYLTGPIPPELGDLTNLHTLRLANNRLTSIPKELGRLHNLEILTIDRNLLQGPIPGELGNLSKLTHLSLYNNQLTGSIPAELGNLSSAESILLWHNDLSGTFPKQLGRLTDLRRFVIIGNEGLTGCVPDSLTPSDFRGGPEESFGHLEFCSTHEGRQQALATQKPALVALYNATGGANWFDNTNWLTAKPLAEWYGVKTNTEGIVVELVLYENDLAGAIPAQITDLTNLTKLYLYGNQLTGCLPPEFLSGIGSTDIDSANRC